MVTLRRRVGRAEGTPHDPQDGDALTAVDVADSHDEADDVTATASPRALRSRSRSAAIGVLNGLLVFVLVLLLVDVVWPRARKSPSPADADVGQQPPSDPAPPVATGQHMNGGISSPTPSATRKPAGSPDPLIGPTLIESQPQLSRRGLLHQRCARMLHATAVVNRAHGASYLRGTGHGHVALAVSFAREAALRRRLRRSRRPDGVVKKYPVKEVAARSVAAKVGLADIGMRPRRSKDRDAFLYEPSPLEILVIGDLAGAGDRSGDSPAVEAHWLLNFLALTPSKLFLLNGKGGLQHGADAAEAFDNGKASPIADFERDVAEAGNPTDPGARIAAIAAVCSINTHPAESWFYGGDNTQKLRDRGALMQLSLGTFADNATVSALGAGDKGAVLGDADADVDFAYIGCTGKPATLAWRLAAARLAAREIIFVDCLSSEAPDPFVAVELLLKGGSPPADIAWAADEDAEADAEAWKQLHRPAVLGSTDSHAHSDTSGGDLPAAGGSGDDGSPETPAPPREDRSQLRGDVGSALRVVSRFLKEYGAEWQVAWTCHGTNVRAPPTSAVDVLERRRGAASGSTHSKPRSGCAVLSRRPPEDSPATVRRLRALLRSVQHPVGDLDTRVTGSLDFANRIMQRIIEAGGDDPTPMPLATVAPGVGKGRPPPTLDPATFRASEVFLRAAVAARNAASEARAGTSAPRRPFAPLWLCTNAMEAFANCMSARDDACASWCGTPQQLTADSGSASTLPRAVAGSKAAPRVHVRATVLAPWLADVVQGGLARMDTSLFDAVDALFVPSAAVAQEQPDAVATPSPRHGMFAVTSPEVTRITPQDAATPSGVTSFTADALPMLLEMVQGATSVLVVGCDAALIAVALQHAFASGASVGFVDLEDRPCPGGADTGSMVRRFVDVELGHEDAGLTHEFFHRRRMTPRYDVALTTRDALLRLADPAGDIEELAASSTTKPPQQQRSNVGPGAVRHRPAGPKPATGFNIPAGEPDVDPNMAGEIARHLTAEERDFVFWPQGAAQRRLAVPFAAETLAVVDTLAPPRDGATGDEERAAASGNHPFFAAGIQDYIAVSDAMLGAGVPLPQGQSAPSAPVLAVGGGITLFARRADAPHRNSIHDVQQRMESDRT